MDLNLNLLPGSPPEVWTLPTASLQARYLQLRSTGAGFKVGFGNKWFDEEEPFMKEPGGEGEDQASKERDPSEDVV